MITEHTKEYCHHCHGITKVNKPPIVRVNTNVKGYQNAVMILVSLLIIACLELVKLHI